MRLSELQLCTPSCGLCKCKAASVFADGVSEEIEEMEVVKIECSDRFEAPVRLSVPESESPSVRCHG